MVGELSIKFIKLASASQAVSYVAQRIRPPLEHGRKVLWLVPGGSAMNIANLVADELKTIPNLAKLTVSLTDERYGQPGHQDSNWRQLMDAGLKIKGAHLVPVLAGQAAEETARSYAGFLNKELAEADFSIALAGMGPDGHIFGVKPRSPAVGSPRDVVYYEWDDYRRLTPTLKLIKRLDEVIIYAVGPEKHPQLDRLAADITPAEQPAQLLKQLPAVTILNDYKGEEI